jgi:hypothetical protein
MANAFAVISLGVTEFAVRRDPEFVEAYNRVYELGLGEGRHVSAKVREMITRKRA